MSKKVDGNKSVLNNTIEIYNGKGNMTYLKITAWGGTADFIARHFKKNDSIYIEARTRNNTYTTKNGTKIYHVYAQVVTAKIPD